MHTLQQERAHASFFLTGSFYRNPSFASIVSKLKAAGNYVGPHSNKHLLYCDWTRRDSLLVSKDSFSRDLKANYAEMKKFGITQSDAKYFLPPYEWYNDSIAAWTKEMGIQLINYTPGTLTHADYTTPDLSNYRSTDDIMQSIMNFENSHANGLNGFILLMHIGAGPRRADKFYSKLPHLISWLKEKNYQLLRVDELLK